MLPTGPFTRIIAHEHGISRHRLRTLVASGAIRPVLSDVYVDASLPDSIALRVQAAALVIHPDHVAVDRTAAYLHGVDAYVYSETVVLPPIETCSLRGHHPTERVGIASGQRDLLARDITTMADVRLTTPLRTSLDLGCRLTARDAMAAMNHFARSHSVTTGVLAAELPRFRGRRGVRQLRELVPVVDPRPESSRESWVWLELRRAGLPLPTPQLWIEIEGRPTYRLDFAYLEHRVAVEYDGEHHLDPAQAAKDAERRAWLRANGWVVIVVRKGDFTGDRLLRWLRQVREALDARPTNLRW